jgi:hypothetical protein
MRAMQLCSVPPHCRGVSWRMRAIALRLVRADTEAQPALGAPQISRGKTLRFRGNHVTNTPPTPTAWHRCHQPAHPAKGRLTALHSRSRPPRTYGLFQTRPHRSPPRRQPPAPANRPVDSGPRPCLISVGFPLSGPQDRTSTSDLKRHARHTRRAGARLRSRAPSGIHDPAPNPRTCSVTSPKLRR